MLAFAQLSNLPAVLKRRNSKVGKPGSSPVAQLSPSSLTLPGHIRRFSSSETLSREPTSSPSSVALVARRSSFSRKIRKGSASNSSTDVTSECMQLDLLFAKIKRKLAEFREEDLEIVDRVDDLVTSVGDLCDDYQIDSVTTPLSDSLVQLVQECPTPTEESSITFEHDSFHLGVPGSMNYRKKVDSSSDEDEEDFQQFCHAHGHFIDVPTTRTMPTYRWSASSSSKPLPSNSGGSKRWSTSSAVLGNSSCKTLQQPICILDPPDNWTQFHVERRSPRPLSYQDIAYEEEDMTNSPNPFIDMDHISGWGDLSCP